MNLIKKLLTLLFIVFSFSSTAMEDPWGILDLSAKASHELNYEGVFHSQISSESNSTHVIHANIANQEYSLLKMLDGAPSEVFSDGKMVYVKSQNRLTIKKRKNQFLFPSILPSDIDKLKENYQLFFGGLPETIPDVYERASPAHWVSGNEPPMLFVSEGNPDAHKEIRSRLNKAGIRNEGFNLTGGIHSEWNWEPWFTPTMEVTEEFIRSVFIP